METKHAKADSKQDRLAALARNRVACETSIRAIVPHGRSLSLAIQRIEEAFMWAVRGVEEDC